MIQVNSLSVQTESKKKLLSEVSFQAPFPVTFGIYGPNGSGKSTLLKCISGISNIHEVSGEVILEGKTNLGALSARERVEKIVYLGSDYQTPFQLTVRELLEMGALSHLSFFDELDSGARSRIAEVIEELKLLPFLAREVGTLSDGEKQWMMFARALVQKPRVLVLDESFSKLDLERLIFVVRVLRIFKEKGMNFIIASHDLNFLSEVSDQLLFLKSGTVLAQGPVEELLVPAVLDDLYPSFSLQVIRSPETGKSKIVY